MGLARGSVEVPGGTVFVVRTGRIMNRDKHTKDLRSKRGKGLSYMLLKRVVPYTLREVASHQSRATICTKRRVSTRTKEVGS
jgi:hypothetical protein